MSASISSNPEYKFLSNAAYTGNIVDTPNYDLLDRSDKCRAGISPGVVV